MPQDIENKLINRLSLVANLSSSVACGALMRGSLSGGITALSVAAADEYLINAGTIKKHYLSTAAFWTTVMLISANEVIVALPEYVIPIYCLIISLAVGIAYYGNDPLSYKYTLEETVKYLSPIVKLFDDDDFFSNAGVIKLEESFKSSPSLGLYAPWNNKLITTLIASNALAVAEIIITHSFLKYFGSEGSSLLMLNVIAQKPEEGLSKFIDYAFKLTFFLGLYNITKIIVSYTNQGLEENLIYLIQQKAVEKVLLNPKHLQKILKLENPNEIIQNLPVDFNNLCAIGIYKLNFITSLKIKEFISLADLITIAPATLIFSQIKGMACSVSNEKFQTNFDEFSKLLSKINTTNFIIVGDFSKHCHSAFLTNSTNLIKEKYSVNLMQKTNINNKIKIVKHLQSLSTSTLDICQKFLQIIYYGHKAATGTLNIEQIPIINTLLANVSTLLQGKDVNKTWEQGNVSIQRVEQVLKALITEDLDNTKRAFSDRDNIILKNYSITLQNEKILDIPYFEISGARCAITGASGIGKSSLLKDLQNALVPPLQSSGVITFPSGLTKFMFIDQNLYLPVSSTLFESITSQWSADTIKTAKDSLKTKIIKLFKKLNIDSFAAENREDQGLIAHLEDESFNSDNLSGGQKKKIGIIKAIITNPQILLADEIFIGLDPKSLFITQLLLNKYLPNCKMIIVDHYPANNNYLGFYDQCIEISNKTCKAIDLPITPAPKITKDKFYECDANLAGDCGF